MNVLRNESCLDRRATIIACAGDKMIPEGPEAEPPYNNGPTMVHNPHYLKCSSYHVVDHVREALSLCEINGIEHSPMNRGLAKLKEAKGSIQDAWNSKEKKEKEWRDAGHIDEALDVF